MIKNTNPSVSIEEFAAFIDGNLDEVNSERVLSAISSDNSLSQLIEDNDMIDENIDLYENESLMFSNEIDDVFFSIPDVPNIQYENINECVNFEDDDFLDDDVIENSHQSHLYEKDLSNDNDNESNLNTIDMENSNNTANEDQYGAKVAQALFGEQGQGAQVQLDPMIFQGNEGICAIRSQQIILRDYGIDVSIDELKQFATQNGWYDPEGGTPMGYIGNLLESCNVHCRQDAGCTVYDLVNELSQGHRVIVAVDANELWADRENDAIKQTEEWFTDVFKGKTPNHALVVAGVEVNPQDPNDVKVVLTDPGTGDLRIEYDLDDFMDAWEDSNCFMTTTTEPAPLQYDPNRGCEVPSNFAMEQFIDTNSLPLNADNVILPAEMAAKTVGAYYSKGHIDKIPVDDKEIDFDDYTNAVGQAQQKYKSAIGGNSLSLGLDHFDKNSFVSSIKSMLGIGTEPEQPNSTNTLNNGGTDGGNGTDDPVIENGGGHTDIHSGHKAGDDDGGDGGDDDGGGDDGGDDDGGDGDDDGVIGFGF